MMQLIDGLTTALSFYVTYVIWKIFRNEAHIGSPIVVKEAFIYLILLFSIMWVFILDYHQAYSYQRFTSTRKEISIIAKTSFWGCLLFILMQFLTRFSYVPRAYVFLLWVMNFTLLALEKVILFHIAKIIRSLGKNKKNILVVGTKTRAKDFIEIVQKNIGWGLNIIGILSTEKEYVGDRISGISIIGSIEEIEPIIHENQIDEVMVCISSERFDQVKNVLIVCEREGLQVRLNTDFMGAITKKVRVDQVYGVPIISFINVPDDELKLFVKRGMDFIISFILLVILSPLLFLIAIAIKVSSRGPVLYQWNVIGMNKKAFRSWKFRTMVQNADALKAALEPNNEMNRPVFKMKNDPRITKIGKVLRKTSLDELPQLWSVLIGDMSLVGPRPAGPHELLRYESWQRRKLCIKPGITCLWQVSGRNKIKNFEDWVKLDLEYIDNWSLSLDLKILLKTIVTVLQGTGC
jgi:exopolysaccharide biosynthesis polyprenyl glycosylphosphotransferase